MITSSTHDDGTMRDASCLAPWSRIGGSSDPVPPLPVRPRGVRGPHWRIRVRARRVMVVQVTGRSKPELGAGGELETLGHHPVLPRILAWDSSAISVPPFAAALG